MLSNYKLVNDKFKTLSLDINQQSESIESTINKFNILEKAINKVNSEVQNIGQEVTGLKQKQETVDSSILSLSAVSQESAASVEEVQASIEELNSMISSVSEHAIRMNNSSKELDKRVDQFRL
jgi:methyl-accepting chemotaxis protein